MKSLLYRQLSELVGPERVSDEEFACLAVTVESAATGLSFLPPFSGKMVVPEIVVKPTATDQVSSILRLANRLRKPVVIRGGGTGTSMASVPTQGGIVLDLSDMNQVLDIDESSMAVRAQAGTPFGTVRHELAKRGYRLGYLGPHGTWGATLGGVLSMNSTGVAGSKYGQLSEDVLTLQVVLPTGEVIETGSRVNSRANFSFRYCNGVDITGLYLGSCGVFGVITEAGVRIYVKEKHIAHGTFGFKDLNRACRALHEISRVGYVEDYYMLRDRHTIDLVEPNAPKEAQALLGVFTETHDSRELEAQVHNWKEVTDNYDGVNLDPKFAKEWASDFKGVIHAKTQSQLWLDCHIWPILRIPEGQDDMVRLFKENESIMSEDPNTGLRSWGLVSAGGAKHPMSYSVSFFRVDRSNPSTMMKAYELWHRMIELTVNKGGCPYYFGREGLAPHLWTKAAPSYYYYLKTIKQTTDPRNILNPGQLML